MIFYNCCLVKFFNDTQNATSFLDFFLNFSVLYRQERKLGHEKRIFTGGFFETDFFGIFCTHARLISSLILIHVIYWSLSNYPIKFCSSGRRRFHRNKRCKGRNPPRGVPVMKIRILVCMFDILKVY